MVAHSGKLVSAAEDALLAAANKARDSFNDALERLYEIYKTVSCLAVCPDSKSYLLIQVNLSMDTMWGRSKPAYGCQLILLY
jgi:indoleamine 2,3-dioxygenase